MTTEIATLCAVIGVMTYLFLANRLPVDLTALFGLLALTLLGLLTPTEAFSGFSSSAALTLVGIFFISGALRLTGVSDSIGEGIARFGGTNETRTVLAVVLAGALVSAFMNDVVAAAIMLPGVMAASRRTNVPPSRLLIPLSFGTILGGMLTLIGTPPNFLVSELAAAQGLKPFGFFDFTPFGAVMVLGGAVYLAVWGRRSLPRSEIPDDGVRARKALPKLYRLYERLFSLRIPTDSTVHGFTLGTLRFGDLLKGQVVAIVRGGRRILAPLATETLQHNDLLIVGGRLEDLNEVRRFQGIRTDEVTDVQLSTLTRAGIWARFEVLPGEYIGATVGEWCAGVGVPITVVALERKREMRQHRIAEERIASGDIVHVLGASTDLDAFARGAHVELLLHDKTVAPRLKPFLFQLIVPTDAGVSLGAVGSSRLEALTGLTVVAVFRGTDVTLVRPGTPIEGGDRLLVSGDPDGVARIMHIGQLRIESESVDIDLESAETALAEVVLAPRSALIGKTLPETNFRERYGFQVLAVWHGGRPYRSHLAERHLEFGDALLLHGPRDKVTLLGRDPDVVVLSAPTPSARRAKAPIAIGALLLMVALSALKIMPIHVAAFCGAVCAVVGGAISMQEAYREIEWRIVFFIAALIPIGIAFEHTGAAALIGRLLYDYAGGLGPYGILIVIMVVSSILSQVLDGVLAVVLLTPISITIAQQHGLSPYPFLMGLALSASFAFLTPVSHKANLLVMNPGGYGARDYLKVGIVTTIICVGTALLLVPLWMPFTRG
jgi:di/tricarboxylate transporter